MKHEQAATMSPAMRLMTFCAASSQTQVPARLLQVAKGCLLDALGCGLFGATQPWGRTIAADAFDEASVGPCTVLGHARTLAGPAAALCNGTAMHGFELDDLLPGALIHPGTVIVPAALAAAEIADAPGQTLLRSIVLGYEATARLSLALGTEPSHRGFHKTAVVGPVASAMTCAAVLGLTVEQLACAVGLACSCASGIKAFTAGGGGGMVKRMHAGRAAEAGVRMARLAARGFTGPASAVDGKLGLLEAFSGAAAQPAKLVEGLGERWAIDALWVKVYPICGWIQGVVQLLLAMRGGEPLAAQQVRKVIVGTSAFAVKNNAIVSPADTMDAQYSIPYCAAVALTGDPGDPAAFDAPVIHDPVRRALAQRVELVVDAECDAVYPGRFGSRVELHLADGSVRVAKTLDPHGTPADPCSESEIVDKFTRLATLGGLTRAPREIVQAVQGLDTGMSTRSLTALLRG